MSTGYADTIFLNNGDKINGQIIRKEGSTLLFKTPYAGEIKIQWKAIASMKTDKNLVLTLENDTNIENASISPSDKKHIVKTKNIDNPIDIQLSSIKYINPSQAVTGKGMKISGRVNVGLSIASGNTDTESFNVDTEVVLRGKTNRITTGANLYQASDNNVDTEDKTSAWLKYDHFLDNNDYIYGNTSFARDKFKDQKLKSTIGLGYGHQYMESDQRNLSVEAGADYVNEDYFTASDDNYIAGRWALKFDQKFFSKKLQFFHNHEGLLELDNTDNVSITSQTGFRFPVLAGMNAALQLNLDWDNLPSVGTKSTDRKFLFTLGYSW